jgi:hypothetical protein
MDEADVRQKARAFIAKVDVSNIREDLSPYVTAANAKVKKEELGEGESGYTITKPNGKHIITVSSLETDERQRFTICHEIAHIVLSLGIESRRGAVLVLCQATSERDRLRHVCCGTADALSAVALRCSQRRTLPGTHPTYGRLVRHIVPCRSIEICQSQRRMPCAFVTMERGAVRYAARSTVLRQAGAWISPRSVIPVGSVAHRIRSSGNSATETGEVSQDVWFDNWEKGLDLWELSRHYALTDTTISLLWFDSDDLPEVEVSRFGKRIRGRRRVG